MTKAQAFIAALVQRTKEDAAVNGSSICHAQWEDGSTVRCHVVHGRAYLSTMDGGRVSRAMLQDKLDSTPPASAREQADEAFAVAMAASLDGPSPAPAVERVYYIVKTGENRFDLRQTRFKAQLAEGREHPHDLCAVGFDATGMRQLVDSGFDADVSPLNSSDNRRIEPPANYPTVLDVLHHHAEDIQDRLFVYPKGSPIYSALCDRLALVHEVFQGHEREGTLGANASEWLDSSWTESAPAWPATEAELDARLA